MQGIIDAPWVAGVERYLRGNSHRQIFVLVSAKQQDELEHILHSLDLTMCFADLYDEPSRKQDAIHNILHVRGIDVIDSLMTGDGQLIADLDAAIANQVLFC